MRMPQILVAIALTLTVSAWLIACETTATDAPADTEAADAAATAEPAADAVPAGDAEIPAAVGAALADEVELTTVAALAADPDAFQGKTVRVQGTVVHACGSGCSMTVLDGESKLLVRADTEHFKFPGEWKDKIVKVEGTFQVDPGCESHHEAEAGQADAAAEQAGDAEHADAAATAEKAEGHEEKAAAHEEKAAEGPTFSLAVTGAMLVG